MIGSAFQTNSRSLTEAAIVGYATQWDPEPFHLDPEAAVGSVFGGLVASGWHSLVLSYSMFREDGLLRGQILAGLGVEDLKFRAPVWPGDSLRVRYTVRQLSVTSNPAKGIVGVGIELLNQHEVLVLDYLLKMLMRRLPHPDMPSENRAKV